MLDIVIIIFFTVMAFKIFMSAKNEIYIFKEFNQTRAFAWLSLSFPLGTIVYMVTTFRLGWLPANILMALCYLPALLTSRKVISAFEKSGTDRVNNAKNAATKSFGTAIVGLLYAGILLTLSLAANVVT